MADQSNPRQFGNRKDTEEWAQKGAEEQSTEDKAKGGRNSGNQS